MYAAGWSKREIRVKAQGYAMMGYGMWRNRAWGRETALWARAIWLRDGDGKELAFCCLDLGYITHAMRIGVIDGLRSQLDAAFDEAALVLTCTHTHSGPGGCSHDALYNVVTPGFVPDNLAQVVTAAVEALIAARAVVEPVEITLAHDAFAESTPVAWNRSLQAYNRNPEVDSLPDTECHRALDRNMPVLALRRNGQVGALLSLFGVHATAVGNSQTRYCADNKGYAAVAAEQALAQQGAVAPVAIFAQATAGDVSPHYHGPGDVARRKTLTGAAEYAYAERNGRLQADHALAVLARPARVLAGKLDAILSYVDFSNQHANARFAGGNHEAFTSEPCHGVAFFAGTRVDGPGMPAVAAVLARQAARAVRLTRLRRIDRLPLAEQHYYRRLYAAQGDKDILLEAGRKQILGQPIDKLRIPGFADPLVAELKRQAEAGAMRRSALVPTVLPLQIIRIGPLALLCCPGEFTTIAGQRLMATVAEVLKAGDIQQVLICTYCNDYMGYVTTREEYQLQAYEGGHTIYGQWTLAAFQTRFDELARQLLVSPAHRTHDRLTRPLPAPADELALRTNLAVPRRG